MTFVYVHTPTGVFVDPVAADIPAAGITITGLDPSGPSVVTLWRSTAGGKRRSVRGWRNRIVYESDYAVDYEVPLGRDVTYELEVVSGALLPELIQWTAFIESEVGFIQDPLMPLSGVPVHGDVDIDDHAVLTSEAFRKLTYAVESSSVSVLGSNEPVAMTGQRMAMSGFDFSVLTEAAEQSTALRNLLTAVGLVLIRPLPSWGPLPDLIYTVPSVSEEPVYGEYGATMTTWSLSGNTVRPPSIDVLVPLWTYADVEALWTNYAEAQAAADTTRASYLDVQRDPTMGV